MLAAKLKILLLCFLAVGCAKERKHDESVGNITETKALKDKYEHLKFELQGMVDPDNGWPAPEDCDGLLWAGLTAALGLPVKLTLAEDQPGHWQRNPKKPPCWSLEAGDQGARATTSPDMMTGLLWAAWRTQDMGLLQRLAGWGETHEERLAGILFGWIMGEPYPAEASRVVIRQNQYGLVGRMLYILSNGADDRSYRHEGTAYVQAPKDYERHIQTLGILLQGEANDGYRQYGVVSIAEHELAVLKANAADHPGDALFQAAYGVYTGDFEQANALLLSDSYQYPSYVRGEPQRPLELVHWLFAAHIVLKYNGGQ